MLHESRSLTRSAELFARASALMPGGVNSPVRSFRGVGGDPLFFRAARGARLEDADGHNYIDYVGSWGPMLLGHGHPAVLDAVRRQLERGVSYGACCELELELAEEVLQRFAGMERIRLVSSGTEAAMTAVRLARAATERDLLVKFEGCYHGHADALLVRAGSGAAMLGNPDSAGVPAATAGLTAVLPFNDTQALQRFFDEQAGRIAAVLVEPIAGNMGMIPPAPGFLPLLRELCTRHGTLLVLDEVMTGFRVDWGGCTSLWQLEPDLMLLGKVLGGGLPVAALAGPEQTMRLLAPEGPVYQAGTLSGNPLALAAGCETLRQATPELYPLLTSYGARLLQGLIEAAAAQGIAVCGHALGGMTGLFFAANPPLNFAEVQQTDTDCYGRFFHAMLKRGIYLPPSAYEAWFISAAHGDEELDATLHAAAQAFAEVA